MKCKSMRLALFIILLSSLGCSSTEQHLEKTIFMENTNAQWLSDIRALPEYDSLFYLDHPAPLFRREFKPEHPIEIAKLYITAAGYYNASINGEPIGKNVLDPAWTDFSKRVFYTEYDLTSMITEGDNCLGVSLGNGFYNPLPLRKWGRRNMRTDLSKVGKPAFIAKLVIKYKNGETEEIISDSSWKHSYGPLTRNSVYIGVVYDANKELDGWNTTNFDDSFWQRPEISKGPGGILQESFFPPVQINQEIIPVGVSTHEPGTYLVDMGVNFTGTYKIKLSGNKGDTIHFRFGERIYENGALNPMTTVIGQIKRKGIGGSGAPDIAWQTDSYIIGDDASAWFQPDFTYHTYRYMEIKGLDKKPNISDIKGLFMHTAVAQNNNFSSSSELLNDIQIATERTFLANLISVQSDCPAREKFGYGGDINATSESFIYNYDMQSFYRKTVYDWLDAMRDTTFVDTAPFAGVKYCGISWESAYLTTQYYLYLYYNDIALVKELYERNKQWMDKAARLHPNGIVEKGLSDHESLEPVPVELTGTSHYLQCARIMETFAEVMNDKPSQEKYGKLADQLKDIVRQKFWDKPVTEDINKQTLFSTLLYHGIVPDKEMPAAKDSLLKAVKNGPAGHFITGIFGTKYILETLSEYVSPNEVFEIVNSIAYPGWGHMIDKGATTIWETWKESDNTYSNCHPMFGTVTEWYYRWLAGIKPDPQNPGFKEFYLAPTIPEDLASINCSYTSPFGEIVSNWMQEQNGRYRYEMTVPEGSMAKVTLPVTSSQKIEVANETENISSKIEGLQTGNFSLHGGSYNITISPSI